MEEIEYDLTNFAACCFRDTGDGDYIAARLAMRAQLVPQFLWSSLQAIEKYLKYILLENRIVAKDISHDLSKALQRIENRAQFEMKLSDNVLEFIEYLDTFGRHRYFETMYYYLGDELLKLDQSVWEIRRYCQPINHTINRPDGRKINLMESTLCMIEGASDAPPQKFRISGGMLEKVLDNSDHPSRPGLIWQNRYFCGRTRKQIRWPGWSGSANSPLAMRPHIVESVIEYVYLPRDVKNCFRQEAKAQAKNQQKRNQ